MISQVVCRVELIVEGEGVQEGMRRKALERAQRAGQVKRFSEREFVVGIEQIEWVGSLLVEIGPNEFEEWQLVLIPEQR